MNEIVYEYLETINLKSFDGVAIIGSYATNTEAKWSDIDILFVTNEKKKTKIEIFNSKYFVSSYYLKEDFDGYFKDPNLITSALKAFSNMKIVYDPHDILNEIKDKSESFSWSSVLKERASYLATREFIGYVEEAQKAIQGLKDNHVGKMLAGLHGLTFGMFQVIRLRDHIQLESDNDFYSSVYDSLQDYDPIKELSECAFGIKKTTLVDQVDAGLEIFMHIGNSMMKSFSEEEKDYIMKLIHEIILVV